MNDLRLPLFDTAMLGKAIELDQRIKGNYGGKLYFFDAYIRADADSLDMVGLDAMGTQIFDLAYSKTGGIRFKNALGIPTARPEYVVADFQLTYYPFDAVKAALVPYGLDFVRREEGGRALRSLFRDGREIIRIETLPRGYKYENLLRGYSYEITEMR
jgi:hypothetical protein